MAIEKVKRIWLLVARGELDPFVQALARSRTTHVVDLQEEPTGDLPLPAGEAAEDRDAEDNVRKLDRVLDILDSFAPPKRSLAQNFVNLPAEMKRDEFDRGVAETDVDVLYEQAVRLQREHAAASKQTEDRRGRIAHLEPWAAAQVPPAGLERCRCDLGTVPVKLASRLRGALGELESIAAQSVATTGGKALVAAVWLREAESEAVGLLEAHGFESLGLAEGEGTIAGRVGRFKADLAAAEEQVTEAAQGIRRLAERRRAVLAARAHWQAEVERGAASAKALASERIVVLSGYVRVRELEKLEGFLAREFPSVSLLARDPEPGEDVPVSLGGAKIFAPAQFLTSMFGLPNYFEFDPSPYIFVTFLIFFGFCFGDVVYGLMLLAAGWWLARKSADYPSLAKFFSLLALCGVSSIVVGALTGSWASDLLGGGYLGSGPAKAVNRITVIDPLKRTIVMLGIALGLGMLNQFYGMVLLMYREWRKGNVVAAVCDGGLWLIFLPGLVLLLAGAMGAVPAVVTKIALGMIAVSGVGLILTQGRHEKTFVAKAITGLVSLYGILGTYGTTSFIGDTLSYSRLLALGLTTVIVGMSFNIIAGLTTSIPVVGVVLFIVIVVFGHMFNFLISILGGFVHSARLIFVEFFTKFYEGGAQPFAPLGAPRTVRVIDDR